MTLVKTRINVPKNNNRFRVTLKWYHGDCDLTTYDTVQLRGFSDEQLLDWHAGLSHLEDIIEDIRSGKDRDEELDALCARMGMEAESDQIWDATGWPAVPAIDKIEWVDDEGIVYSVTGY